MIYHSGNYDLDGFESQVRRASKKLRPYRTKFTSIVVTGMSGVLVGAPLALRLKCPLVVLRKEEDSSHHSRWESDSYFFINKQQLGKRPLWVDDFVSGGATRERVNKALANVGASVAGEYLYRDNDLVLDGRSM